MSFNHAGLFSTDDAGADRRQIEAEQFVDPLWENDEEDPYYPEREDEWDFPAEIEVIAWCSESAWHVWQNIFEGNFESFESEAQKDHDRNCKCGDPGNFDAEIISK